MSDTHVGTAMVIERQGERAGMSPVVSAGLAIMKQNPSLDALQQLLSVQREWEANEARKAYSAAMVGLKRDLPTVIAKDKTVSFNATKYTHTSLGAVMEAITGPLTQHGFSLTWKPSTGAEGVTVTCRLTHSDGHFEEATISAPVDTSGSKSKMQGVASTITLLQRYSALSLLGIATADMKDPEPDKPTDDAVNSAHNLKAMGWLAKQGKTKVQAEELVGRSVKDWTTADLAQLKAWATTGEAK